MERNRFARRFTGRLRSAGYEVLNDVVLIQVLVSFGDDRTTSDVIRGVPCEGTFWCGGTSCRGQAAMRISVSSWTTTGDDVERSLVAILKVAHDVKGKRDRPAEASLSWPVGTMSWERKRLS